MNRNNSPAPVQLGQHASLRLQYGLDCLTQKLRSPIVALGWLEGQLKRTGIKPEERTRILQSYANVQREAKRIATEISHSFL